MRSWGGRAMNHLSQSVLVLNRLWQAVNVCSARRAFILLYTGQACVVEGVGDSYQTFNFGQWCQTPLGRCSAETLSTVSLKIRIPKVIQVLFYDRFPKKEVKFTRQNVYERDRYTCQYCGELFESRHLNLDHVVPRDRGGVMQWENIVSSCLPCNSRKGNRTPPEAGMKLWHHPKRPRWRPSLHLTYHKISECSWRDFLDINAWNVEVGSE